MIDSTENPEIDIFLFNKLEASYHALATCIVDPVCIANPYVLCKHSIFHKMFYYCEDYGEDIVRNRIRIAASDIRYAAKKHSEILQIFESLENGLNDRKLTSNLVSKLCSYVISYSDYVEKHQRLLGENSFLYYPSCSPGHLALRGNAAYNLSFNPSNTKEGIKYETDIIHQLNVDFENQQVPLNMKSVLSCSGPYYAEYFELLKNLLEREFNFALGV